jgi:hypothetical protein
MMTGTPSSPVAQSSQLSAPEVEIDERYVAQTLGRKFRGFCRCRCGPGYLRAQKFKVLFRGVCGQTPNSSDPHLHACSCNRQQRFVGLEVLFAISRRSVVASNFETRPSSR